MEKNLIDTYNEQVECCFINEMFSVRDNGSVLRHAINDKRLRQLDNKWTFGNVNKQSGYLQISSISIHRIVATAFHGNPPTKNHVVDHIDTNRQNNRPENLRWVTRLENLLLNPITVKKIELICGNIEAFLENPSKFKNSFNKTNFSWMGAVSFQEATACKNQLINWAKSETKSTKVESLSKWIYYRHLPKEITKTDEIEYYDSITKNAIQIGIKTATEFICCPDSDLSISLIDYSNNLKVGQVFSSNKYFKSIIEDYALTENEMQLFVVFNTTSEHSVKPWYLVQIFIENNLYVHKSLGSFFTKEGALKQLTIEQGFEWQGESSIDDYC